MNLQFEYKPDLDAALERWRAFWQKDIIRRPCVAVTAPRHPHGAEPPAQYLPEADFNRILDQAEDVMSATYFGGEAMPFFQPSFGPDQLAAFVGGSLNASRDSNQTTWSEPFVDDWDAVLPLHLGRKNTSWSRMLDLCEQAARRGDGRYGVGMLDLHSNLDWLAAIRGPDQLCLDLMDQPAAVLRAMDGVRELYPQVYQAIHDAGGMAKHGTSGWLPYFCEKRFAVTQCDFCLLLSPAHFQTFVLPALEAESVFLDHSVYHYDGRGALRHFDAITGIQALDGIQWTPSAGDKPLIEWIDLLKACQARGKNVFVSCPPEQIPLFHRELKPNLVFYSTRTQSRQEAEELLQWLEDHT